MELTRAEKIDWIKDWLKNSYVSKDETKVGNAYLKELESKEVHNNIHVYEQFGTKTPRHTVMNYIAYFVRNSKFGFTECKLNKHGWIEQVNWLERELVAFKANKESWAQNHIDIGRGKNGLYAIGVSYSTGTSGGGGDVNEYGDVFENREDAILSGVERILVKHYKAKQDAEKFGKDSNYSEKYSKQVVKLLLERKKEIVNPVAEQFSLF